MSGPNEVALFLAIIVLEIVLSLELNKPPPSALELPEMVVLLILKEPSRV
jgi:hypothetical protein